jgi:hypothetical protein
MWKNAVHNWVHAFKWHRTVRKTDRALGCSDKNLFLQTCIITSTNNNNFWVFLHFLNKGSALMVCYLPPWPLLLSLHFLFIFCYILLSFRASIFFTNPNCILILTTPKLIRFRGFAIFVIHKTPLKQFSSLLMWTKCGSIQGILSSIATSM